MKKERLSLADREVVETLMKFNDRLPTKDLVRRKAELPARLGGGKEVKKVRVALLGPGSSSSARGPETGLIELPETVVRRDIESYLPESLVNSIDSMESNALVKIMVEFGSKALILRRRVGSLY
ncbi:hypothetical protein DEO72_LG3g1710 [Vigna unguiculata]|uniref:Uncharacterized protein n=1 Tax=Vigna unguiculata TaxID=3917 RepID=A0A4D6LFJ2_VIGUN|nr:hypothetical protein DEO72_LG3g1710 [Vigna unguiculata]